MQAERRNPGLEDVLYIYYIYIYINIDIDIDIYIYIYLYLKLAWFIENLPAERWVKRAFAWKPVPTQFVQGGPQQLWDAKLEMVCQYKALNKW